MVTWTQWAAACPHRPTRRRIRARRAATRWRHGRGTVLPELAVLLVCAGVMAVLVIGTLGKSQAIKEDIDASLAVREAYRALQRFVLTHHRLPCPDLTDTGREGDTSGACPAGQRSGGLPYVALGLDPQTYRKTLSIRYGVWRDAVRSDLVRPVDASGNYPALRGNDALIATAFEVAGSPAKSPMPYVAGHGQSGVASNCDVQASNPAYVLTAAPAQGTRPMPADCFGLAPGGGSSMAVVTRSELLGWLLSTREAH
jgi:hypothetical protein